MFTLKFMRFFEDSGHVEDCLRCPHYEARQLPSGDWEITAYPSMVTQDGVSRRVQGHHPAGEDFSFDSCFVENENGKTIAKYCMAPR